MPREPLQRRNVFRLSRLWMLPLLGLCLASFGLRCDARAVNVSNTWTMPQEGLNVFYRFFRDRISWFEADAVCQFHHANLVTVDNSFQFDATRDLLRELDVNDIVWIGLMRPQNSDRFMWSNSRPLVVDTGYWAESLPLMDAPLCAVIDPIRDYRWHALRCGGPETASFLCEMPVPSWADACILKEMPNLTMQYMADTASIELIRNCQEEGLLRHSCKGKEDRERAVRELICPKERLEAQRINDITNSHFKSLQIIKSIRTDNNENNDIDLLPLVANYAASVMKIEVATAAPPPPPPPLAPVERFSLDRLIMPVARYHIPDEVPMPVKKSAKKVNPNDEHAKKLLAHHQTQMRKASTTTKPTKTTTTTISHLDMMMGDQPALSEEQLPEDVSDSDVSNEIFQALPHKKKILPQDLRTMPTITEATTTAAAATTTATAATEAAIRAKESTMAAATTTTTAAPATTTTAATTTTTTTSTTTSTTVAATPMAATTTLPTSTAAPTTTTTTEAAATAPPTTTTTTTRTTTTSAPSTTESNIMITTTAAATATPASPAVATDVTMETETDTTVVAATGNTSNTYGTSTSSSTTSTSSSITSTSSSNIPTPTTTGMPLGTSTTVVSIAHPIHPVQQSRDETAHPHVKETADNSHFIPPMLLVKSHYVPPSKHGEHGEHKSEHLAANTLATTTAPTSHQNVAGVTAATAAATDEVETAAAATKMTQTFTTIKTTTTPEAAAAAALTTTTMTAGKVPTTEAPTTATKETTANENSSNPPATAAAATSAAGEMKGATKLHLDSESETGDGDGDGVGGEDELELTSATTRRNFLQEETEAPFKPNRHRSLTKPETVSYFKKILG
ncbi:mucin-2 [Drosophila montana]|uniref:mucin-2 n=1 Tax=Drosophila montana TaxID=40370 RepID=UPI00313AC630